ncbi:NADPH-dependent FMN reductase [Ureibacillus massiliensis 4400831 = CIP 108448 = CCUG 49529]|uniref:NADPH-dependent FMN reductase n=1 Tax=Ureibacillus massiliensis 4400831 = CIP 108448 = CCUG 49529 TaxID=1211035 RepID=A0A0A3IYA4_9BACL|nr:NAD(P)H-dependent oxidoreductase [Ureibacillus massiliensis]KGR88435.1 NADPH-dependent FMN reductase [Ureibacillus massiliensis 4400831 = CIP 108448 = CCUG 49529]
MVKIALISGSLRKDSVSTKIAKNVGELFPTGYETEFIEIGQLPLFNEDYEQEGNTPAEYTAFRNKLNEVDAVLFVTPEYNRSFSGALKNALDVGSRPYGQSVWNGKPAAVISQSPGNLSGFGANHHLRQVLVFLNMPTVQQPEVYLANSFELFDESGKFNNQGTIDFLQSFVNTFVDLINKYKG